MMTNTKSKGSPIIYVLGAEIYEGGYFFHLQGRGPGHFFTIMREGQVFFCDMFSENVSKNMFFFILGGFKTLLNWEGGYVKILTINKA